MKKQLNIEGKRAYLKMVFTSHHFTLSERPFLINHHHMMTSVTITQTQKRKGPPGATSDHGHRAKKLITFYFANCPDLIQELGLSSSFFQSSRTRAWPLDPADRFFKIINSYVERSRNELVSAKVLSILKIITNHGNSLADHEDNPNNTGKLRMMLWHGTQPRNIPKILKEGFKLPKKKSDPWFGAGIYFADSFSYSLSYCKKWIKDKNDKWVTYLFLSDVLLGEVHKTFTLIPKAPQLKVRIPGRKQWETKTLVCVKGCGIITVDPQGDQLINGSVWPLGEKMANPLAPPFSPVPSNEYVVYEESRVIPKYLVKIERPKLMLI